MEAIPSLDEAFLMAVADKGRVQGWAGLLSMATFLLLAALVRQGWLKASYALVWFGGWATCTTFIVWPGAMDRLAGALGIGYSPTLILFMLVFALSLVTLHLAVAVTRLSRQVTRLAQEQALRQGKAVPPCAD